MKSLKIKTGDQVRVITCSHKGTTGKVLAIDTKNSAVQVEGIAPITRHLKRSQQNPSGGTRDVRQLIHISNVALVHPSDSNRTTRIGYLVKPDGTKVRVARQAGNKEIE